MKICKFCGALNNENAEKCGTCNNEFILDKRNEPKDVRPLRKNPLWLFVALGISVMLLTVYTIYVNRTYDDKDAFIIYPLLIGAIVLVVGYWISLQIRSKRMLDDNYYNNIEQPVEMSKATAQRNAGARKDVSIAKLLNEKLEYEKTVYKAPSYNEEMTGMEAVENMRIGALIPEKVSAKSLLAAMSCKRTVIVCAKDDKDIMCVENALGRLTGHPVETLCIEAPCSFPNDLYIVENEDDCHPSDFLCKLVTAKAKANAIVPIVLKLSSCEKFEDVFDDLKMYMESTYGEETVCVKNGNRMYANSSTDEKIALSQNARLVLILSPEQAYRLPYGFVKKCAFIELKNEIGLTEEKECLALSYMRLNRLAEETVDSHYLSEDVWKKIDAFEAFVNGYTPFSIDNKLASAMERFVGVYMAAGAEEIQALDAVFATLLLPGIISSFASLEGEPKNALNEYMDTHFGFENIPISSEILKKFSDV